jgi:serine/threonine protein kinase
LTRIEKCKRITCVGRLKKIEKTQEITMLELQEPIAGRYRLQQRLRRGGMSLVYLGYDELMHSDVAIKLVSSDDADSIQRLHREVQAMSKLSHDHILPILDYGEHDSYHYLVMPYMKRGTLRERIAKVRLTKVEAGNILAQVASALQFAHDQGIVHRDIKPSNILIDDDDEQHIYLADFGLAKALEEGSDLTQTGYLIGTPEFMAPELADRPESVSSDIYALGVLLYQMLTGRTPFTGSTPISVYWKHLRELPAPPSHLNPAISHAVEQVILCALNKDPQHRFPSAKAMAQAYEKALKASEQTGTSLLAQNFAPAVVTLYKAGSSTLPDAVRQTVPQRKSLRRNIQRAIVALAAVVLLATPLSLGFLVARGSSQAPLIASASAQFAANTQQTHHASTPTPRNTQVAHSVSGNSNSQQSATPQHKNKHKHGNGNGSDDKQAPER